MTETPEPCTEEARAEGCTCRMSSVWATDINPPEIKVDKWCPLHGKEPDYERDKCRDS